MDHFCAHIKTSCYIDVNFSCFSSLLSRILHCMYLSAWKVILISYNVNWRANADHLFSSNIKSCADSDI